MARIAGMGGTISIGAAVTGVTNWSINVEGTMADATGMDSTIDDGVRSLAGWTVSCNGHWETTAKPDHTDIPGAAVAISFADGTNVWSGNALMTRFHAEATVDGTADWSLDGTGTGALACT